MLNWAFPGALWLLLSVIPIALFYFLRMRFKRQPVSSIYIWSRLRKDNQTGSRLRLRSILLLLLQVLTAVTIAATVAQPFWEGLKPQIPGELFLIDASASMSAADIMTKSGVSISRWDSACKILEDELKNLPGGTEIALFICSSDAEKIAGPTMNNASVIKNILTRKPSGSGFKETEVAKSLEAWLTAQNRTWNACLISDGGLDLGGEKLSLLFNGNFKYIPVGSKGDDLGLTGLRFQNDGTVIFTAYNGYSTGKTAEIALEREGIPFYTMTAGIQPGKRNFSIQIPGDIKNGVYTVRLIGANDNFPQDDNYTYVKNPEYPVQVLLAGPDNPFLNAALNHKEIKLTHIKDFTYENSDPKSWDLTIADRTAIPVKWNGNLLCFNVLPKGAPVYFNVQVEGYAVPENSTHPLLRFADIGNWYIASGNSFKAGQDIQVLARVGGKPVLAVWETNGSHIAVIGTDLTESDIGLSAGFPVFLQNILKWCVPQFGNDLTYTMTAGDILFLKAGPGWKIKNTDISGFNVDRNGSMMIFKPRNSGIFSWEDGERKGSIAVNIPSGEMDLTPRSVQALISGSRTVSKNVEQKVPLSGWIISVLLVLLITEWFIWRGFIRFKTVSKSQPSARLGDIQFKPLKKR